MVGGYKIKGIFLLEKLILLLTVIQFLQGWHLIHIELLLLVIHHLLMNLSILQSCIVGRIYSKRDILEWNKAKEKLNMIHNRNHAYNKAQQMDMKLDNNNINNSGNNLQQRFFLLLSMKSKLYRCLLIQVGRFHLEDFN